MAGLVISKWLLDERKEAVSDYSAIYKDQIPGYDPLDINRLRTPSWPIAFDWNKTEQGALSEVRGISVKSR